MSNLSKSGVRADNTTVAQHSLSNANIDNDDYSTVKNMNVHVSGNIEEVAPTDDDNSMDTGSDSQTLKSRANDAYAQAKSKASDLSETVKTKANELGQQASEGWEAAKIKGASAYETVKQEVSDYTNDKESDKQQKALGQKLNKDKSLPEDKAALKDIVDDHVEAGRAEGDKSQAPGKTMTQSATEYATAARDKAAALAQQAHDKIQDQTESDKPLREQAQQKASEWANKIETVAGQAKDKVYEYAGYAKDKVEKASTSDDSSSTSENLKESAKKTAGDVQESASKAKDAIKQATSNASNKLNKSDNDDDLRDQSQQTSSPSLLSQASSAVTSTLNSAAQMLGLSSSDKTTVTTTYESTERVVDKDEESGKATVAKSETWTEQKDNEPAKSRSKKSEFETTI